MGGLEKLRRYLDERIQASITGVNTLQRRIEGMGYESPGAAALKSEQWGYLVELNTLRNILAAVKLMEK